MLQAFFRIAEKLDIPIFGTTTSIMQRKKLLARLELLLKDGAEDLFHAHSRSLHLAVLLGKEGMLGELLSEGLNPDEAWPNSGWTPLHLAAQEGKVEMAQTLLEASADPKPLDHQGYSPINHVSRQNHPGMMELLLESENPLCTTFHSTNFGVVTGREHRSELPNYPKERRWRCILKFL